MKKALLSVLVIALLISIAGCSTTPTAIQYPTTTPTTTEAPDDLVITPAGMQYRANVQEAGVTNPWSTVQTTTVNLSKNISVEYRSYIETQAGETRNNIIFVRTTPIPSNLCPDVDLTIHNTTSGIDIYHSSGGGFPGNTEQVLTIGILSNVEPGEYSFDIGLVIDGEDYGQLPCTINVTGQVYLIQIISP